MCTDLDCYWLLVTGYWLQVTARALIIPLTYRTQITRIGRMYTDLDCLWLQVTGYKLQVTAHALIIPITSDTPDNFLLYLFSLSSCPKRAKYK